MKYYLPVESLLANVYHFMERPPPERLSQENPLWSIHSYVPGFCVSFLRINDIFPVKTGILVFLVAPQILSGIFVC